MQLADSNISKGSLLQLETFSIEQIDTRVTLIDFKFVLFLTAT